MWNLIYSDVALKQLKKLNKKNPQLADRIMDYLDEIALLDDPRTRGKALTANLAGRWRYRIEDFRAVCEIKNDELVITALNIAHRSEVYK
ncbi:addiction module toxin RelE [Pasteurellaceae bacterium LFhippo2]|nr:addiction module toxin RelE [Pasteurellaceae bacterium LFhippo2]